MYFLKIVKCENCLLVKYSPVATEEAVLGGAGHDALVVLDGQADVEDLVMVVVVRQACGGPIFGLKLADGIVILIL